MTMTTQTALFNAQEGIQKASETAGEQWIQEALFVLKDLLRLKPSFFCDDIWEAGLHKGKQPKALGQVIRIAVKEGWIEEIKHANGIVAFPSNSSNRQLKRVWKSNLYEGDQPIPSMIKHPKIVKSEKLDNQLELPIDDQTEDAKPEEFVIPSVDVIFKKYTIITLLILVTVSPVLAFISPWLTVATTAVLVAGILSQLNYE